MFFHQGKLNYNLFDYLKMNPHEGIVEELSLQKEVATGNTRIQFIFCHLARAGETGIRRDKERVDREKMQGRSREKIL